jgi:outer membrane protein TolC
VIEAQATEATRADNLELASRVVRNAQAVLHRQLALPDAGPGTELVPIDPPDRLPPPTGLARALATAFEQRPERADALLEIASKKVRLKLLANQKLPKVDLVASYNQNGLGGGFGTAFDQAVGSDFPGYLVGLQVELPLRRRAARGAWDQGRLEKEQALLQLKAVEDQLQEEVTKAVTALETALRRVEVSSRAAQLSERQLEAAQARYQQGLIANFDLLRFQQDLADARSRALKAVVDSKEAGLALQAATGTLLEDRGISLEEAAAAAPAPAR